MLSLIHFQEIFLALFNKRCVVILYLVHTLFCSEYCHGHYLFRITQSTMSGKAVLLPPITEGENEVPLCINKTAFLKTEMGAELFWVRTVSCQRCLCWRATGLSTPLSSDQVITTQPTSNHNHSLSYKFSCPTVLSNYTLAMQKKAERNTNPGQMCTHL